MSERRDYSHDARDTIVKSSLTGVAATVIAVTAFSPAGFGGVIGTSVAASLGLDRTARASEDPYAHLPPFSPPLTQTELTDIRGELARTAASLAITRAATDGKIDYVRNIAEHSGINTSLASLRDVASMTVTTTSLAAPSAPLAAPQQTAAVQPAHRDGNLQLAALLLAHESL
ncbi:MAG: hypothetical protein JSS00_15070 [Proteobacteria bacterium]|nr:hypothetical protein [Pseudomonadota bacterium]